MIKRLMTNSRTTEVDAVSIRMIGAFKNTSLNTDTHLSGIFTALGIKSTQLTTAIGRMKVESELEEKDEVRDSHLRALFILVQGYLHHPYPNIKAAAEKVDKVLENYGLSMIKDSYATESSLLNSILEHLEQTNLQDAITELLGCAELITSLQTAQDNFETCRIAYEEEKAEEDTLQSATTIKKEVITIINEQLVVYLKAMNQVDVETYGSFTRTAAEIISNNNEQVKKRSKKQVPAA